MKNIILSIVLIILSISIAVMSLFTYSGKTGMAITFMCGAISGMAFGILKLNSKNKTLNSYKRELEKESIASDDNASRVKVLESKIEVLEKALENALKDK